MKPKQKYLGLFFFIIATLIILTLLISFFNLDIKLEHKFYRDNSWYIGNNQPWLWLYKYGTYPSIILSAAFLIVLLSSITISKFVPYRRYALLVLLTLFFGPGLIINAIFKDWWGRPRPRQIQDFGGKYEFRQVWQPGVPGKGNSFPSGHSSMGFHFIVVYYIFRRRRKLVSYLALSGSVIYGTVIGIARMVQGGHFASDVLWSAGFTYLTAIILYYVILKIPQYESENRFIKETSLN